MNDCLWCWTNTCINCQNMSNCKTYISINQIEIEPLMEEFEEDVNEAMKDVVNKWSMRFNEYKTLKERE